MRHFLRIYEEDEFPLLLLTKLSSSSEFSKDPVAGDADLDVTAEDGN